MTTDRLIYRYEMAPDAHSETVLRLPCGAEVLFVNPKAPELWATVPIEPLRGIGPAVRVAHTGRGVPQGEYVGTFIIAETDTLPRFVGHVYVGEVA